MWLHPVTPASDLCTAHLNSRSWVDWAPFHGFAKSATFSDCQRSVVSARDVSCNFFRSGLASPLDQPSVYVTTLTVLQLSNNHDHFALNDTFIVDVAQPALAVTKMILMTKFDSSETAERWFYVSEEKLSKQLTPATWLKHANAQPDGCTAVWANQTPKVRWILCTTPNNIIVEDKNAFI